MPRGKSVQPTKPRGFSWKKYFKGSKQPEKPTVAELRPLLARYRLGPLAECHPKLVQTRGVFAEHGRVRDECPEYLHDLEIQFTKTFLRAGWAEAKLIFEKIRDYRV